MNVRMLSPLDRLLAGCERALEAIAGAPAAQRPSPAAGIGEAELDDAERRHAAGLMRINHTGEVSAQVLYFGQAALARNADNRETRDLKPVSDQGMARRHGPPELSPGEPKHD